MEGTPRRLRMHGAGGGGQRGTGVLTCHRCLHEPGSASIPCGAAGPRGQGSQWGRGLRVGAGHPLACYTWSLIRQIYHFNVRLEIRHLALTPGSATYYLCDKFLNYSNPPNNSIFLIRFL